MASIPALGAEKKWTKSGLESAVTRIQRRMEVLLQVTEAATRSLDLEEVLRGAVEKVAEVVTTDRCSVVLVEGAAPQVASVVASREFSAPRTLEIELADYPELRRALETKEVVHIEDASCDPLMDEVWPRIAPLDVKSILVQPLIAQDDCLGVLLLRLSRTEGSFGREERDFVQAVAAALANSVRNARLHGSLRKKRDELESAYVDRYRELTEANRRLKELNRLKDDLIAICSHDLRAPLQVMLGHGRLLQEAGLDPQQSASAAAIVRQTRKIQELVESLLDRGKGEQARVALDARMLDLSSLCEEMTSELEILAAERGVAVRTESDSELWAVADAVKLREVLQNLITNAIHHAKDAGEVVVRTERLDRPDAQLARIIVRDDGEGMPQEDLHLVFDRYRHGPGGTGLGLSICKEFVELHGGEIWAESPESGGCAFHIQLPLARTPEQAEAQIRVAPLPEAGGARVLVVEDEPEVAAVLEEILRSRYRVEVARDGAEGVAKARASKPDLVVMDVFLPRMDGLDAAVALKSSTDTAEIPVILLSAHRGVADKVRALNLGAVDYMGKPFQALELLARVDRALHLRRTEQELARSRSLLRQGGLDPATGLLDRSGFEARLEQERARGLRHDRPLALVVLLPCAPLGDRIREVASHLRERTRVPDVAGHIGDGVFAIALPECEISAAERVAERLASTLSEELGVELSARAGRVQAAGSLDLLLEPPARASSA